MFLGIAASTALAVAPAARAASTGPFTNVPVTGLSEQGQFTGTLDIQRFEAIEGHVLAVGIVRGAVGAKAIPEQAVALELEVQAKVEDDDDHGQNRGPNPGPGGGDDRGGDRRGGFGALLRHGGARPASLRSEAGPRIVLAQAACPTITLNLAGAQIDLLGLNVNLGPAMITLGADPTAPTGLGALLCNVGTLLDNFVPAQAPALANTLNQTVNTLAPAPL
jgi:hypothetical protein